MAKPGAQIAALQEKALEVLLGRDLEHMVDLVAWSPGPGCLEVASSEGSARITFEASALAWDFSVEVLGGTNPLALQDPTRFSPLDAELSDPHPPRERNSYPYAYEHLAQVFDHPCAPDLIVQHSAAHRWEAHLGEHGSLGVVQARAPFIAAGPGIARGGMLHEHCRLVDLAPTVVSLLGRKGDPLHMLARQDGRVLEELLDEAQGRPEHVLCILLDGCNANVLYSMAWRGDAPNLASIMEAGTTYAYGAFASFPTVTLANHTTLLTGCHPGHHGVLHNAWFDRRLGAQVVTESPSTWQEAMSWLAPGTQTIHHALSELAPGSFTASINEPADAGAGWSTFDLFRHNRLPELMSLANDVAHADTTWMKQSAAYGFSSIADTLAMRQTIGLYSGSLLGTSCPLPSFAWVSFTLTDSAFHEGGPHSDIARAAVRDTDARIGEVLASLEKAGIRDETTVFVVADHGMEQNDPSCTGTWNQALLEAGVVHRDEASGFIYLGEHPDDAA